MATSSISATLSPLTLRNTSSTSTKHDFSTPSLFKKNPNCIPNLG
ncbi:unnamed protein product [Amaranthus hypochondriacus]